MARDSLRPRFDRNEPIEARYKGREKYYPGKIDGVQGDGSYDIWYCDGETEIGVRADMIPVDPGFAITPKKADPPAFAPGARVRISGLKSKPELDGVEASVLGWHADKERFAVRPVRAAGSSCGTAGSTSAQLAGLSTMQW